MHLSDKSLLPLVRGGEHLDVTPANRSEYLRLAEAARLNEALKQLQAIRRGLADVVPPSLLNLCTSEDLMTRVCGKPQIDIKLLKVRSLDSPFINSHYQRHTEYSGVLPTAPHVVYFWQVLESFSQEDLRAFVRFAWAQERLPASDHEFERAGTRMMIKPFSGTTNPDEAFPKADTCFFNLMLPEYSSPENLKQRLLFAIHTDADSMNADVPAEDEQPASNRRRGNPLGFLDLIGQQTF